MDSSCLVMGLTCQGQGLGRSPGSDLAWGSRRGPRPCLPALVSVRVRDVETRCFRNWLSNRLFVKYILFLLLNEHQDLSICGFFPEVDRYIQTL